MPNVPNEALSSAQRRALDIYRRLTDKNGEPPSVREFAEALSQSRNAAHYMITRLREKGYLTMKPVTLIRPSLTAKGRLTAKTRKA